MFITVNKDKSMISTKSRNFFLDPSLWILLFSNLLTIYLATKENWDLSTILGIYWFQSVTIGFFNFIRILSLKSFSTKGVQVNGQSVQSSRGTKIFIAFFFLFHYGFFHVIYLVFLFVSSFLKAFDLGFGVVDFKYIFSVGVLFFLNHLFSYFYNRPKDSEKQNIGTLMFYPYARIIPMHLTIIFGFIFGNGLVLFLGLKTLADIIMHVIEHRFIRKGVSVQTSGEVLE